jgi:hypothetical protein
VTVAAVALVAGQLWWAGTLLGHSHFRQDDALLMLRELFGNRATILVPLTVYLFSPLWLAGVAWWSEAIADGQLPACLPEIICLIALGRLAAALILPGP